MKVFNRLALRSRQSKVKLFLNLVHPSREELLLFLGAGIETDLSLRCQLDIQVESIFVDSIEDLSRIVMADVDLPALQAAKRRWPQAIYVCCDGRKLPFVAKSVSIVLSNATIEHVGPRHEQQTFAEEVCRVGCRWFVTTPNFYFPFEFHYRLPFIHYLPRHVQRRMKKYIGGRYPRGTMPRMWLLTPKAMRELFPTGHVVLNRVTILPETIIAWGENETDRSELPQW